MAHRPVMRWHAAASHVVSSLTGTFGPADEFTHQPGLFFYSIPFFPCGMGSPHSSWQLWWTGSIWLIDGPGSHHKYVVITGIIVTIHAID